MTDKISRHLDAEIAHAGETAAVSPLMLRLEQMRITSDMELPPMEFLFTLFGTPCLPRGELVGLTGKAKSGKTYVASMLMVCCLLRSVLLFSRQREEQLRVLWFDTEQSDQSTQDILKHRLVPMAGEENRERVDELFDIFNVRCADWKDRRSLLCEAVRRSKADLVIVDGIRDLVNDINDGCLAQEVMEELMHLASETNSCIVCVLHENKGSDDHNLRGWIGTELMHKAFEVYACEKLYPQRMFKMTQLLTRKHDIFQPFYFEVNDQGLPVCAQAPEGEGGGQKSEKRPPLNRTYIINDEEGGWRFDVSKLFTYAMKDCDTLGHFELQQRIMSIANIKSYQKSADLFKQAIDEKVIEKTYDSNRHVVYKLAPF